MIELAIKKDQIVETFKGKNYEHIWLQLEDQSKNILDPTNDDYNRALAQALNKPYDQLTQQDYLEHELTDDQIKSLIIETLPKYHYTIESLNEKD